MARPAASAGIISEYTGKPAGDGPATAVFVDGLRRARPGGCPDKAALRIGGASGNRCAGPAKAVAAMGGWMTFMLIPRGADREPAALPISGDRKRYSAEETIRIGPAGLRGEQSMALGRREGCGGCLPTILSDHLEDKRETRQRLAHQKPGKSALGMISARTGHLPRLRSRDDDIS